MFRGAACALADSDFRNLLYVSEAERFGQSVQIPFCQATNLYWQLFECSGLLQSRCIEVRIEAVIVLLGRLKDITTLWFAFNLRRDVERSGIGYSGYDGGLNGAGPGPSRRSGI